MKGILTNRHTGEDQEIYVDYKILEIEGKKIFQLDKGITGYESFYIDSEYNHLENVCDNGWTACVGTKGVWDKLFIPAEEMRKALAPFLKAKDEKVVIGCGLEGIRSKCEDCPYKLSPLVCEGIREVNSWKLYYGGDEMDPKEEAKNVMATAGVMIGAVVVNGVSRGSKLFEITLKLESGKRVFIRSNNSEDHMVMSDL